MANTTGSSYYIRPSMTCSYRASLGGGDCLLVYDGLGIFYTEDIVQKSRRRFVSVGVHDRWGVGIPERFASIRIDPESVMINNHEHYPMTVKYYDCDGWKKMFEKPAIPPSRVVAYEQASLHRRKTAVFEYIRNVLLDHMHTDVVRAVVGDCGHRKMTRVEKAMIVSTLFDKFQSFCRYPYFYADYRPMTSSLIQQALLMLDKNKRLLS